MNTKQGINTFRTTAIVVGIMYIGGFVVGLLGEGLIQSVMGAPDYLSTVSANSMLLAIGALLWLVAVVGDAAHGVMMFPILKQRSERIAFGYLAARIIDAVFIAVMVLFILVQIPLGSEYVQALVPNKLVLETLSKFSIEANQYAYQIGMMTLGVSGLLLNYLLYKAKLVPRWLAVWGLVGYTIIFVGMASEIMGSGLGLMSSLPGGFWEVFMGGWLIVKGFNASAFVPEAPKTSNPTETFVPQPVTVKS